MVDPLVTLGPFVCLTVSMMATRKAASLKKTISKPRWVLLSCLDPSGFRTSPTNDIQGTSMEALGPTKGSV